MIKWDINKDIWEIVLLEIILKIIYDNEIFRNNREIVLFL